MLSYSMIFAKFALGLLALALQINLMGKGNLAPTSALDQIQNYVLGGIIGGVIYNDSIGLLQFVLILLAWTILVLILKFLKGNVRFIKVLIDGKPTILIDQGRINIKACMRAGMPAYELHLKLRSAGVQRVEEVKRAVLEQNGQLTIVQNGEENIRFPLIADGQINTDVLTLIDKDEAWLEKELRRQGYKKRDVYLAEYLDGQVILYPYQEKRLRKRRTFSARRRRKS